MTGLASSGHNQTKLEVRGHGPFTPPGAQCRWHDVGYSREGSGMGCPPSAWGRAGAKVPISMTGMEILGILLEARVEGRATAHPMCPTGVAIASRHSPTCRAPSEQQEMGDLGGQAGMAARTLESLVQWPLEN